jgi:hypothetical protein
VTCAQLATLNDGGSKDLGDSIQGVDGHEVMWDASFGGFHGPGQYGLADVQFYLTVDTVAYYPATGSSLSITVGPDFATKLTFAQLKSSDGAGAVSGNLSWTCKDPT